MQENAIHASPPTSRVLSVLEALAQASDSGLSSSQIARDIGASTSTTASVLATLDAAGYVERLPTQAYRLGSSLLRLLPGLHDRYPLLGVANEELTHLFATTGHSATLARITADDQEVVLAVGTVAEFETPIGHRMPTYPPHGAVSVAWRTPDSIEDWLREAPEPLAGTELNQLRATLAGIRERGYAVYSARRDARTMVTQVRTILSQVDNHAPPEVLRPLLLAASAETTIYTTAELADRRRRPVSYVIAPVFGPNRQPRYLVTLHIMQDAIPARELDHCIEALTRSAAALGLDPKD